MFQVNSAALTHPGRKRPHNEDFVTYFEPGNLEDLQMNGRLYIVADGVGGAAKGERASQYATEKVLYEYYQDKEYNPGERLKRAMRQAGNDIFEYAERSEYFRQMATTLVAAAIHSDKLTVANVGDSRAYLIRNRKVWQITKDHTTAGEMVRDGVLSIEEARRSKAKNRLTRSLGGEPNPVVDIFPDIPLLPGDTILLCSDGLTRYARNEDIIRILDQGRPESNVEQLVDFANQQGGVDNISVVLVRIETPVSAGELVDSSPRGQIPTQVDWENMETQPEIEVDQKLKRLALPGFHRFLFALKPYRLLLMIWIPILCVVGIGGFFAVKSIYQSIQTAQTETATVTVAESATQEAPTQTTTDEAVAATAPTTPMVNGQTTITPTTETVNSVTTPDEVLQNICVKLSDGEFLEPMLSSFEILYNPEDSYFYYEICENKDEILECQQRQEIVNHNYIEPKWWIEILGVSDEVCLDNRGEPDIVVD